MTDVLSPLQRELVERFFARTQDFFLTGGAALAGFYFGHRRTEDLDFFSTGSPVEEGDLALAAAAEDVGATIERVKTFPAFQRRIVRRGSESVVVDLVRDPTAGQLPKEQRGAVRLDSLQEILANKLCALLGRSELRDLVDVLVLERRGGLAVEEALPVALRKDRGATPGQLAWVLSQIRIGDDARIPAEIPAAEIQSYLADLTARLSRLARPPLEP